MKNILQKTIGAVLASFMGIPITPLTIGASADNPLMGDTQGRYIGVVIAVLIISLIAVVVMVVISSKKK